MIRAAIFRTTALPLYAIGALLALGAPAARAADAASGTVSVAPASKDIQFAYLVRVPGASNAGKGLRRVYFSATDIGAQIKACKKLSCADGALSDGAYVDFNGAERIAYKIKLDGGKKHDEGTIPSAGYDLDTDEADHLAGRVDMQCYGDCAGLLAKFDVGTFATLGE